MHNEILLSFIKKKNIWLQIQNHKIVPYHKKHSSQSDFFLKTVFISVSPCYQNYTLSHFHQISNLYRDSWNKRKRSIKMIPRIYFGILFSLLLHLTKAEERIFDQITWIEKKIAKTKYRVFREIIFTKIFLKIDFTEKLNNFKFWSFDQLFCAKKKKRCEDDKGFIISTCDECFLKHQGSNHLLLWL